MASDKYRRVDRQKPEPSEIQENEIRIMANGNIRGYITYATTLLEEKNAPQIVLKAMGRAIAKTVRVAEIVKRRVLGLHQIIAIESNTITDVYEPLEEGLNKEVSVKRQVSSISITLSKEQPDTSNIGYQPPLSPEEISAFQPRSRENRQKDESSQKDADVAGKVTSPEGSEKKKEGQEGSSRGRRRGSRANRGRRRPGRGRGKKKQSTTDAPTDAPPSEQPQSTSTDQSEPSDNVSGERGRGRGRGRSRGRRGTGRGRRGGRGRSRGRGGRGRGNGEQTAQPTSDNQQSPPPPPPTADGSS